MSVSTTIFDETSGAAFNAVLDVSFSAESNVEPITRADAKRWLRVDDSYDDFIIDTLIIAAREICEKYLNHSIITRTVTAILNNSCGNIYLPYGPVKAITSVTDANGNILDADQFTATGARFVRIKDPLQDNLKIIYTAGYEDCPAQIKIGMLCQIAYMYENRGDDTGLKSQLSPMAKSHLKPIKM